ncbi:MAG: translation initiation factor [Clostridiales bacterium]|jgi:translation initiation factor IF-2|nr:translation initiation factor [Clostridiales bacterium]MDN5281687.1 translation initiation factor [Candidatus Ozemobacter sp.]
MGIRLHEASKQYNLSNKELAQILGKLGYEVKAHQFSAVSEEMLEALEKHFAKAPAGKAEKPAAKPRQPEKPQAKQEDKEKKSEKQPAVAVKPAQPAAQKQEKEEVKTKKTGPKPARIEEEEEVEVNKQITIIKTAPPKKEIPTTKKKKGKNKRAHFSKKVQAEMREAERQTESILDRQGKNAQHEESSQNALPRLTVPRDITVSQLAKYLDIEAVPLIKTLFGMGVVASLNQRLEDEHIQLMGQEYGKEIVFTEDVIEFDETPDKEEDLQLRPPVVTIMGHVDHGKTSLLDYIRKAHVADKEVGGITQHIGAYQVKTSDGTITFIDTPGHEAFTAMRAQGALVTDIAILVVAADDGVQPQTIEAIHHAQAAGVPIIVAINKMDKPEANPDRIKQQLMPLNLVAEDWGGQTTMVQVSAKSGKGVEELLEMILLQSEMMELKANPNRPAQGTIIEAKLDKGMGPIATVLIQNGRIRLSDNIICGTSFGRVKALINDSGARVKEGGPSFPVAILGLNEVPKVGDKLAVVESAKFARYVGELRQKKAREERLSRENRMKLADLFKRVTEGQAKDLNIIIKADVQGSSGALKDALERLSTDEVKVNVIHTGVGGITEADVNLASASNAIIIGFHVRPMTGVDDAAKKDDVEIKVFKIIYDAIDAVKLALKGMYEPIFEEEVIGRAEVRKVYRISGIGAICGSYVTNGMVTRHASVRIVRDGIDIYEGKIKSLKRFKDDVREVHQGYECGISVENFNDIKDGDILEFFRMKEIEREI